MKMRLPLTLAVLATGEKSASMGFTQQVIIVVLTAALSTFLISLIFRWIDQPREEWQSKREHQRNLEQKRVEADLARQSKRLGSTFCKSRSRSFRRQIPSKHRTGDTKKTLSSFLVGLAMSFGLPTFAQQKDAIAGTAQQRDLLGIADTLAIFGELNGKLDDAYNNKDAAAAAALFTEDAVLVTPDGMVFGRDAIEKRYTETFQRWPITDFLSRRERLRLNAIDNAVWSVGEWSGTLQSQAGPVIVWGYWSTIYVREGDAWKIRMLSLFDHRPLSPSAQQRPNPAQVLFHSTAR